jgi:hypothetical protein
MTRLREAARELGLGRMALNYYHRPLGLLRQSISEGGPLEQRRTAMGHAEMIAAAADLPTLVAPAAGPAAEVAYVSGAKYWHQTAFCFASLQLVSPYKITPVVFDDGTLADDVRAKLRRVIPWIRFVSADEIEDRLDRLLPEALFPSLRARRRTYPHLRKLTDIHVASTSFTLVLDSDMLFFRRPAELLAWFASPHAVYMQDVMPAYGYPDAFLADLVGAPIPQLVNVGLYGLHGGSIEWNRVEHWCRRQLEVHGTNYLQEQALTAMIFVGIPAIALPRRDYVVKPGLKEGREPKAVLHHYVGASKRSYFQHAWQRVFDTAMVASRAFEQPADSA